MQLTPQDRESVQQAIVDYEKHQKLSPTSNTAIQAVEQSFNEHASPDEKETQKINKRVKGLWRTWRKTVLDAKSVEVERFACEILIERAKTKSKIAQIKRDKEIATLEHWVRKHRGNLQEIGYNTESKPSAFWYTLRRGIYHFKKLTNDLPKIVWNLLLIGLVIAGYAMLKKYGIL